MPYYTDKYGKVWFNNGKLFKLNLWWHISRGTEPVTNRHGRNLRVFQEAR